MSEISSAIKQLCEEKSLDYKAVIDAVELALAAAYRKDYGDKNQNVKVDFDPETGKSSIYDVKTVVENLSAEEEAEMLENLYNPAALSRTFHAEKPKEELKKEKAEEELKAEKAEGEELEEEEVVEKFNPKLHIQIKEAMILKSGAKIGDEINLDLPIPESYGRMAAQTAKQVIIQKIREMERDMILAEFKDKENEVVSGIIQRQEGRFVFVDLGKAIGLLPIEEQIRSEVYNTGNRIKVYIKEVREGYKGPEIILSRRSEEILKKIFYLEIPEIANGLVEIKAVAREAGSRSKVAIWTEEENVDPVGSCVGQRGSRVQTIISELGGEKIDIIEYNENAVKFIANSLAPAKVLSIELDEEENKASVKVSSDKLSLAIGKAGQNVRLAARLTGWKIDIIEALEDGEEIKVIASDEEGVPEIINEELPSTKEAEESHEDKKEETEEREEKVVEDLKKEDKEDKEEKDSK